MLRKFKIFLKAARSYFFYKLGNIAPVFCSYLITAKCNLNCKYCPIFSLTNSDHRVVDQKENINKKKSELNTEESKKIIDWLSKIGNVVVSFSGGEPLLRNDLEKVAKYAKEKNMITFLNTNGTLITKKRAKSLSDVFDVASISLVGNPKTDDKLRGRGVFKKTKEGIKFLKKEGKIKINLNFVINKFNFNEIDYILNFAKKNCDSLTFLPVSYVSDFFLEKKKQKRLKRKYYYLKKNTENLLQTVRKKLCCLIKCLWESN